MSYKIFCISHGRANNALKILKLAPSACFIVKDKKDFSEYKNLGIKNLVIGGKLSESRNLAISMTQENNIEYCIQISDDIKEVVILDENLMAFDIQSANALVRNLENFKKVSIDNAVHRIINLLEESSEPFTLCGIHPTGNKAQALMLRPTRTNLFALGDFLVILADSSPRFDPRLRLKEDYDFTAQHITQGMVLRDNRTVLNVSHYRNSGGAVSIRTERLERDSVNYILQKWEGSKKVKFSVNKRRKPEGTEILLRSPPLTTS